jgi:uncharacterized protein
LSWLLDTNALIALAWDGHEHHEAMHRWFEPHAAEGWATTAFVQAGFLRIASQPWFSSKVISMARVAETLLNTLAHPRHRLLAMDFEVQRVLTVCTGGLYGHRQVTDAFLLAAAARHRCRLLTFDNGIPSLLASDAERQRLVKVLEA